MQRPPPPVPDTGVPRHKGCLCLLHQGRVAGESRVFPSARRFLAVRVAIPFLSRCWPLSQWPACVRRLCDSDESVLQYKDDKVRLTHSPSFTHPPSFSGPRARLSCIKTLLYSVHPIPTFYGHDSATLARFGRASSRKLIIFITHDTTQSRRKALIP